MSSDENDEDDDTDDTEDEGERDGVGVGRRFCNSEIKNFLSSQSLSEARVLLNRFAALIASSADFNDRYSIKNVMYGEFSFLFVGESDDLLLL